MMNLAKWCWVLFSILAVESLLASQLGGPEPTVDVPGFDAWITLTSTREILPGGEDVVYQVRAGNHGPDSLAGITVEVNFDPAFTVGDWTCEAIGIASCVLGDSGSGNISGLVALPPGDSVLFTISANAPQAPEDVLAINSELIFEAESADLDLSNNSAMLKQKTGVFKSTFEDLPATRIFDPSDLDHDGWSPALGDCCEDTATCPFPSLVNPGAFEVLNNGVDDDCDLTTADDTPLTCSSEASFSGLTALSLANAMDLCRSTTVTEPLASRRWGLIDATFTLADGSAPDAEASADMENLQTAVLVDYGTGGIVPQAGGTMAGLSNGMMRDKNDPGYVAPNRGTILGSTGLPPANYLANHNGALPSSRDCSNSICPSGNGANDSVNLKLRIRVPTNAMGFSFQFRFFSSEYWTYSCTEFNDFSLALLTSEAPGIPGDHNIIFDALNNPLSVNNGYFDVCQPKGCYTCPEGNSPLTGTGMEDEFTGGGTVWLKTTAPVVPGEIMQLELMIFDVSDNEFDSILLLDAFDWILDPVTVGTGPT